MENKLLRFTPVIFFALSLFWALQSTAQTTTSHSPYSQFGLGQMREDLLPQQRSMGGIAAGVRHLSGLPALNIANPASYSGLTRAVFDGGMYGNITQLGKGVVRDNTADFAFSHFTFGIPLTRLSRQGVSHGFAFGILPFSDIGYNASSLLPLGEVQYRRSLTGEGGINKAFAGYGISPVRGLSIGANAGFLFGNLTDRMSVEFPYDAEAYNAVQSDIRHIRGVTIDYGVQYVRSLGNRLSLSVGYSGSLDNSINNETTTLRTITQGGSSSDIADQIPLDTIMAPLSFNRQINLPLKHSLGFTLSKGYNWMVGADFKYADWSNFQTRAGEPRLGKNMGVAVGGQFKPDPTSTKYLNVVDYRLGFRYNQTEVTHNSRRINDMAITAGIGLPLSETNFGTTFSAINISAEFGQQGTLSNNLIRERYINLHFGFTINDQWFRRRSYD